MRVLGLDLSLTSTGLAEVSGGEVTGNWRIRSQGRREATLEERDERISSVVQQVHEIVNDVDHDLFVVENPSYGSQVGSQHDRSGLWWLVVDMLLAFGRVATVPPNTRALYAAGRGNAGKEEVFNAAVSNIPGEEVVEIARLGWRQGNDLADALVLAAMGARRLGEPVLGERTHARTDEALEGAAWPS
ncbi:crossover junction endodeoxyribonuclease RuvC [Kineococcus esterisolvens]|uniref:crossover junction endodeoxyribonuclease RuvC n=1 Tax=unclassified Kineococcus TaxID=2621656 RepID=UPI003D7D2C4A